MWIMESNGEWFEYVPKNNKIYVILHGFNGNTQILEDNGWDIEEIYLHDYDKYPTDTKWGDNTINVDEKNLATLVDTYILPKFYELIKNNEGPALVLTGSRGGQITLSRLWKFWRGPSICLNGGCSFLEKPPHFGIKLGLITCGNDFFHTSNLVYTIKKFQNTVDKLIIYHNELDDHAVVCYNEAILILLNKFFNKDYNITLSKNAVCIELCNS